MAAVSTPQPPDTEEEVREEGPGLVFVLHRFSQSFQFVNTHLAERAASSFVFKGRKGQPLRVEINCSFTSHHITVATIKSIVASIFKMFSKGYLPLFTQKKAAPLLQTGGRSYELPLASLASLRCRGILQFSVCHQYLHHYNTNPTSQQATVATTTCCVSKPGQMKLKGGERRPGGSRLHLSFTGRDHLDLNLSQLVCLNSQSDGSLLTAVDG